jgi:hypothetical protein
MGIGPIASANTTVVRGQNFEISALCQDAPHSAQLTEASVIRIALDLIVYIGECITSLTTLALKDDHRLHARWDSPWRHWYKLVNDKVGLASNKSRFRADDAAK